MKNDKMQNIYKIIMLVFLTAAITFIVTTVALYGKLGNNQIKYVSITGNSSKLDTNLHMFLNYIKQHYIGEIDEKKMYEEAIKGFVKGLNDPYSEYITADEMESYMADTNGHYIGIGIYIGNNTLTNQLIVIAPIKGGPSEGILKSGDIITKVDGVEYTGEQLSEASSKLKGEEGTTVKVEIIRDGDTLEVEITRRNIKINHITAEVKENSIGYINISTFDDGCYNEFMDKYNEIKDKNITSLIVDLRNNGGGIVEEAVNIADSMTDKDSTLLITRNKGNAEQTTKAKNDKTIDLPIVILVNENTASASEILVAALKENIDCKVVGKTTYGKGVIQTIVGLTDGSGLKLTTEEYYTPNHNVINKEGIHPDYDIDLPEDETYYTITEENDTQLKKAIELLK